MKYLLPFIVLFCFSLAHAEENTSPALENTSEQVAENVVAEENISTDESKETAQTDESVNIVNEEPVLRDDVFSKQFINALYKCQPAVAQNEKDASDAPLIIIGIEENSCHLKYGDFNLFLPLDILPNLHGFDDLQILLRNREIARFDYQPQYIYTGLLHALNSCGHGTDYLGIEKSETHGNIRTTNSLETEFFQDICTIYLVSKLEVEGAISDYTVTCKIGADAVAGLLNYYHDLLEKYGEKRIIVNGKPKIISEQENEETRRADAELMFFLQQKGYCQRPNTD